MGSKNSPSRLWRQPHLSAKPEPNEMVPVWKGRRRLRIWSFRHPGGNGMQQASSDAEGAFGGRTESATPTFKNDSAMQNCRSGPMSTREGQAASVTLLRREQLRSASAPTSPSQALRRR